MWRRPFLAVGERRLVGEDEQLAVRQGQRRMRAAAARLRQAVHQDFRLGRIGDVDHGQAAVAPGGVGDVAVEQRVVQRVALAGGRGRRFAAGAPHARYPAAPHDLRLARLRHVDDGEDVVGEIGEVDRGVRVAPAHVPDAVRAHAVGRHEADLARLLRLRDVVDPDAGGELDPGALQPVGGRAAEIVLLGLELLHRPDARRVHRQQQIVVGLQVKRARARRAGDEVDDLRVLRVAHIEGGDAVAVAVADVGVAAMHHDLHAVAVAAHVRVADELDAAGRRRASWRP